MLKDKHIACNMLDRWQQLLREKEIAVTVAVDFHSRVDNDQLGHTHFNPAMETITDLEKVDCRRATVED